MKRRLAVTHSLGPRLQSSVNQTRDTELLLEDQEHTMSLPQDIQALERQHPER